MSIYINAKSPLNIDGKNLLDYLKETKIEHYIDRNLKDVEDKCCISLIDLSDFDNSNVSLKCGADIGFSNGFMLMIIAIIRPENIKLKDELKNFGAHTFKKEDVGLFFNDTETLKQRTEQMLKNATKRMAKKSEDVTNG
jgi:hypothetical protein